MFTSAPSHVVEQTTVHAIGRCPVKGCRSPKRRYSGPGTVRADRLRTWTDWKIPAPAPYTEGVNPYAHVNYTGWTLARWENDQLFERSYLQAMRGLGWVCEEHGRFYKIVEVKGVVNADKTCNSRCVHATGGDCECSCGGTQHGAAYA